MRAMAFTIVCAIAYAASGCGDDSSDGEGSGGCSAFKACGGDIVGNWEIKNVCFEDSLNLFQLRLDDPECDGVVRSVDAKASGAYVFKKDGISSTELTLQLDIDLLWSEACLSAIANGAKVDAKATCSALEKEYSAQPEFEGTACNVKAGGCACLITTAPMSGSGKGEYEIAGNEFIDLVDGDSTPYCVAGDKLTVNVESDSISGQITLVRK